MRKFFTLLCTVLFTVVIIAQAPQKMSYQAVIRNSSNVLVISSPVGMRVSILQGSASGTEVYKEIYNPNPQTNANGLVTIEIGGGVPVTGTIAAIDWSAGTYFIKTETDPTGGTNYTIIGTSQLLSVPYSLHAKTSEKSSDSEGLKQQIKILEDNLIAAGTYKLSDIEGNQYNVVKIGSQVWMRENLKTTKLNDTTHIPLITSDAEWSNTISPAFSYPNGDVLNKTSYGVLYNWYTVNTGKLCPTGWHVPTDAEWTTLTTYLGGESVAGGKMKEIGLTHWIYLNIGATNESGFTALPAGQRTGNGTYGFFNYDADWWSPTEVEVDMVWYRVIRYSEVQIIRGKSYKYNGLSVRCIRD